ncbi:hypothetical protein SVIOM74S_09656 [Streptomyces violarus]
MRGAASRHNNRAGCVSSGPGDRARRQDPATQDPATGSRSTPGSRGPPTTVTGLIPRLPKYASSLAAITNRSRCPVSYRCTMPGSVTVKLFVTSGTRTGATRRRTRVRVPSGATS